MGFLKWFYPGLYVKRWIVLVVLGAFLSSSGIALLVASLFPMHTHWLIEWGQRIYGPLAKPSGAGLLFLLGIIAMVTGLFRVFRSVILALIPGDRSRLVDVLFTRMYLNRGPRIVVVGGGTGLSVLLRGVKKYTSNITAIVSVTDDGGSSGRLRGDLGILPPGDIRNCLVALADKESLMEELLQYRFPAGELAGHNLGNLLIAAMNDLAGGFHHAIRELSKVLAVRGQVLPSTLENVSLGAEFADGNIVFGESKITKNGGQIKRVFLHPDQCFPLPEALQAIAEADAVVLGPGSLYTSILPNLKVNGLAESIARTRAVKIYVCNIMTQPGETSGYTAAAHVKAIFAHAGKIVDYAVINNKIIPEAMVSRYVKEGSVPVVVDSREIEKSGVKVVHENLLADGEVVRHNHDQLAGIICSIIMRSKKGQ